MEGFLYSFISIFFFTVNSRYGILSFLASIVYILFFIVFYLHIYLMISVCTKVELKFEREVEKKKITEQNIDPNKWKKALYFMKSK